MDITTEMAAEGSNRIPQELTQVLHSLSLGVEPPVWTLKRSAAGVVVTLFWQGSKSPAMLDPLETGGGHWFGEWGIGGWKKCEWGIWDS